MSSGVQSFRCFRNGENTKMAYKVREVKVTPQERREVRRTVGSHVSFSLIDLDEKTDFIPD